MKIIKHIDAIKLIKNSLLSLQTHEIEDVINRIAEFQGSPKYEVIHWSIK